MTTIEKAIFAAGCFWGIEHRFREMPGVIDAISGYIGGDVDHPTYKQVCSGTTNHAEAVEVSFNPALITYDDLLQRFWSLHNPTQLNRQGPDIGTQYRSAIFYLNEEQHQAALHSRAEHQKTLSGQIVTKIDPAATFWPAEDYHQRYIEKNGGVCHI